jgi:hypothetical protein
LKVIIVAKGPGWEDAPMEGETWGVNDLLLRRPVKLTFEIHPIPIAAELRPKEIEEINRSGIPVITSMKHELLPNAIVFPLDKMPIEYFDNSIAYMIAYALYKGATEIEMYGVALIVEKEYSWERPCVEFWIGYAMGKGVKVTVHEPTTIGCFKDRDLYGHKTYPKT